MLDLHISDKNSFKWNSKYVKSAERYEDIILHFSFIPINQSESYSLIRQYASELQKLLLN